MTRESNAAPDVRQAGETHGLIDEGGHYSKDYWDLVIEQLARRPLFKVGVVVLTLIYGLAIFAPLIGNDRPVKLVAVDYGAYAKAERLLGVIGRKALEESAKLAAAGGEAEGADAVREALEGQLDGVQTQVDTVSRFLPEETEDALQTWLLEWSAALRSGVPDGASAEGEAATAGAPSGAEAASAKDEALDERAPDERGDDLEQRLLDAGPVAALELLHRELQVTPPTAGGPLPGERELVPETRRPLLENLGWTSVFFMGLWWLVALWPFWNRAWNQVLLDGDRERIRRARNRKFAVLFGVPLVFSLLFGSLFGYGTSGQNSSPEKYALTTGDAVPYEPPLLAPMPYGFAETHTEEKFRPPTWLPNARLDSNGQYMVGARMPKADATTGYLPPPTPVETRFGEPWPNAPHRHLLGTDELGRDFFVRLLWGGRVSLVVGLLSAFLLTVIGVVMGSLAGYFGGWVDILIMRVIEILQSIPAFFLILATVSFIPPDRIPPIFAIVIVIALVRWTGTARLVRGEFLRLRDQEFVIASEALGFSNRRTIFKHVLPNAMSPVLVSAAFAVAAGILTESAVSFLGFGVQYPQASWGSLVNESKSPEFWWIQVFPGLMIFLTVTCYNLVGDAISDAMDPKMKV